jgi:hypothetical protein
LWRLHEVDPAVIEKWARLVVKLFRIRGLQRIWAYLGHYLNGLNHDLRQRLRNHLPLHQ